MTELAKKASTVRSFTQTPTVPGNKIVSKPQSLNMPTPTPGTKKDVVRNTMNSTKAGTIKTMNIPTTKTGTSKEFKKGLMKAAQRRFGGKSAGAFKTGRKYIAKGSRKTFS